jgi:glutaredoxin
MSVRNICGSRALAAVATLLILPACSELDGWVDELAGIEGQEQEPALPAAPRAPAEPELPQRPPSSTARSETEVISFQSLLDSAEMTREQRIRAFQSLDPGALQKPVVRANVTDGPSGAEAKRPANARAPSDWEMAAARRRVPVLMYSAEWCGVCKQARTYFEEKRIAFEERDVDKDPQARAEYQRLNPRRSVPTIKIGDQLVIGFSANAVERALDAAARTQVN